MKNNMNGKKKTDITTRILAGALALLMLAGVVFGVVVYLV